MQWWRQPFWGNACMLNLFLLKAVYLFIFISEMITITEIYASTIYEKKKKTAKKMKKKKKQ